MDESNKLPLKRVELSLSKFNEVAIPHHLDLLRQHKANIVKHLESGEYGRVRAEQSSACRAAARLRALLAEMDALRRQVQPQDTAKFDVLTQRSRELTLHAIMDYRDTSPLSVHRRVEELDVVGIGEGVGSVVSTDSVGLVSQDEEDRLIQLQVDEQEVALLEREAVLRGWSALQAEVGALHSAWQHMQAAALAQRDDVTHSADSVHVAADNVQVARAHLLSAERLRGAAWATGGAVCGALAGGPVGLAVGAKAGAAAALAGSLLGYLGGRVWGRRIAPVDPAADEAPPRKKDD